MKKIISFKSVFRFPSLFVLTALLMIGLRLTDVVSAFL